MSQYQNSHKYLYKQVFFPDSEIWRNTPIFRERFSKHFPEIILFCKGCTDFDLMTMYVLLFCFLFLLKARHRIREVWVKSSLKSGLGWHLQSIHCNLFLPRSWLDVILQKPSQKFKIVKSLKFYMGPTIVIAYFFLCIPLSVFMFISSHFSSLIEKSSSGGFGKVENCCTAHIRCKFAQIEIM